MSLADTDEDYPGEPDFVGDLLVLSQPSLDELDTELDQDAAVAAKDWHTATGGRVGLDDDLEDLTLADADGKKGARKIPFYDVAFNYVAAFDLDAIGRRARGEEDEAMEEDEQDEQDAAEDEEDEPAREGKGEEPKQEPKKGWGFGLFGRK